MSNAPPTATPGSSFEAQATAFAEDPRIYFSKTDNTWHFEDDDGTEMEFDGVKGVWVPILDEDLIKQQQAAYSVAGVDEEAYALAVPANPVLRRENKKRKDREDNGPVIITTKKGKNDNQQSTTERKAKNTAVYVTGLPLDTELDELVERFSKCGVIEEDDEGEPKIKMYAKEDGSFNGEALVVYFKEDSVTLAVNLLDEAELRLGDPTTVISVQKADFTHKHSTTGDRDQRRTVNKKKITKRLSKMQRKLQEWDDADGFGPMTAPEESGSANKDSRVVVLKHMFTLQELEEDASLLLDLKEDVREECSTLGEVTNVVLYDQEPEGIMTVKFRDHVSALACVMKMNGRYFDGRRVEASLYFGRQRFKRGAEELDSISDEAEKKRLDDFAQWLMAEGD
ncbi:hypothetical protein M378DRAFT_10191 [Amanita muscaria Koide BX008]|uniref:RRM domain-containing protein n=1 Tax=Amanita muscaria (strain Koide BX008) TaxID=946122 RepID=A0A0C2WWJ8_AMAMK|nr:hypothetical protein M378DRAFT_10191 [Amanita muscaria Koide BX008]